MMEMEKDVMAIAYAISAIDLNQAATNPRVYTEVPQCLPVQPSP